MRCGPHARMRLAGARGMTEERDTSPAEQISEPRYVRLRSTASRSMQEILAERGIRMTSKRKAILEILEHADQHLDASGVLEAAQQRLKIDRATVYRTLDLLKRQGLIDELDLMHMRGEMHYYEARTGDRDHFHFVCFGCGRVQEVEAPLYAALKQQVALDRGVRIEVARLEMGGYCAQCHAAGITEPGGAVRDGVKL